GAVDPRQRRGCQGACLDRTRRRGPALHAVDAGGTGLAEDARLPDRFGGRAPACATDRHGGMSRAARPATPARARGMAVGIMAALLLSVMSMPGLASPPRLDIHAASGHADEQRAVRQLQRLLGEYDVARWIFTREVVLEKWQVPHSHPVLTLNSAHLDDDLAQLAA